jgi:hypothetical protein
VWRSLFDGFFAISSALLAIFFGAALGNVVRGVPLGVDHFFFEPLWTNFRTGADTGILDWYTCGAAVLALVALVVHGALYVALKTKGAVNEKSRKLARRLLPLLIILTAFGVPVTAAFYSNLLGWKETYDEGSQHELMIGEVGDVIIRGGNPNNAGFGKGRVARSARIDHISFRIEPRDTNGVKAELEKRGLEARIDTASHDDIHTAAYKSYHTTTPNGYNLQISYVTRDNRLTLAKAVKPKS